MKLRTAQLSRTQKMQKRFFDIMFAGVLLGVTWWIILLAWLVASISTRANGLFFQKRVGLEGEIFHLVKIRTMRRSELIFTNVTTCDDPRITKVGRVFRKLKIDELPQLFNVIVGDMSIVGPRPDVPGFADVLEGEDRAILSVRPGLTGPASLKYRHEEVLLAKQANPEEYNRATVWPDKVRINLEYLRTWSLGQDLLYIVKTVTS